LSADTSPQATGQAVDANVFGQYILLHIKCVFTANSTGGDVYVAQINEPRLGLDAGEIVGLTLSFGPGLDAENL